MRATCLLVVFLLSGCTSLHPALRDAVQKCKSYLPDADYKVVELARIKDAGIWRLLDVQRRRNDPGRPVLLDDWSVHWPRLEWWGEQGTVTLVMLEKEPDTLILCEVSICPPLFTWLKRVPRAGWDKWQVERVDTQSVCATASP